MQDWVEPVGGPSFYVGTSSQGGCQVLAYAIDVVDAFDGDIVCFWSPGAKSWEAAELAVEDEEWRLLGSGMAFGHNLKSVKEAGVAVGKPKVGGRWHNWEEQEQEQRQNRSEVDEMDVLSGEECAVRTRALSRRKRQLKALEGRKLPVLVICYCRMRSC